MSNDNQQIVNVTVRDGATPGSYEVSCEPNNPTIKKKNTMMVYQLTSATPAGIRFISSSATPQGEMGPATVSNQGRTISFNNANTKKEKVKVKLELEGTITIYTEPEVTNDPQPG